MNNQESLNDMTISEHLKFAKDAEQQWLHLPTMDYCIGLAQAHEKDNQYKESVVMRVAKAIAKTAWDDDFGDDYDQKDRELIILTAKAAIAAMEAK